MAGVTEPLYPNMVLHLITPNICNYTVQHQIDAARLSDALHVPQTKSALSGCNLRVRPIT